MSGKELPPKQAPLLAEGNGVSSVASDEGEIVQATDFLQVMYEATYAENRAISEGVTRISLHNIVSIGNSLEQFSHENEGVEAAQQILISPTGTVNFVKPVLGEKQIVRVFPHRGKINLEARHDRIARQEYHLGAVMHTHPWDLPPSARDLLTFFYDDNDLSAATCVIVITPDHWEILFRGKSTLQLPRAQAKATIDSWEEKFNAYVNPRLTDDLSFEEQIAINRKVYEGFYYDLVMFHDLKYFRNKRSSNIVELVTADQLVEGKLFNDETVLLFNSFENKSAE